MPARPSSPRVPLRHPLLLAAAVGFLAAPAAAQQFATDDAALTRFRSVQVEAWAGRYSAWLLPAAHLIPDLELSAGAGLLRDNEGHYRPDYVVQAKWLPYETEPGGWGLAFALGTGVGRQQQVRDLPVPGLHDLFAYAALSRSFGADAAVLHANGGWRYRDNTDHRGTWAARGDLRLHLRVTAIAELYGVGWNSPTYQAGFRLAVVPDLVSADLSYGWGAESARFVVGVAVTP
jgi:hypothetical protein